MATLAIPGRHVLRLIEISGGTVLVKFKRAKLAYTIGDVKLSEHWVEQFMAQALLEPGDAGLLPDATPQSLKLSLAALELLERAA